MMKYFYNILIIVLIVIQNFIIIKSFKSIPYKWKNVVTNAGGGVIQSIVFNQKQKDLIYATTKYGGSFRWDNTTEHWIPLLDFIAPENWSNIYVKSLATDPVEPNRVYISAEFVKYGESLHSKLLRSEDFGKTWNITQIQKDQRSYEALTIDPNDNRIIYCLSNGLLRSTDYGNTFQNISSFKPVFNLPYDSDALNGYWIVIDPKSSNGSNSETIYVGISGNKTGIYQSKDSGKTWTAVEKQPTGYYPQQAVLGSDGTLYVSYSNVSGNIWKLDTKSVTWTNITPVNMGSDENNGFVAISVDAINPNVVVVITYKSLMSGNVIFRSINGGENWTRIWEFGHSYGDFVKHFKMDLSSAPWLHDLYPDKILIRSGTQIVHKVLIGWKPRTLAIDPFDSDHMLYGTEDTIFGTNDLTNMDKNETIHLSVRAQGIEDCVVGDLISPPKGPHLVSSLSVLNGFKFDDLDKAPNETLWKRFFFSHKNDLDYAELNPEFIVRAGDGSRENEDPVNMFYTNNSGLNWFKFKSVGSELSGGIVAVAADASRIVWFTDKRIYYSTDNGENWIKSNGIPPKDFIIDQLLISDRVNPLKFYVYMDRSIFVSIDGGINFNKTVGDLVWESYIGPTDIKAVPGHEGDVWFASGGQGLLYSNDSASTFKKIPGITQADYIGIGKGDSYPSIYISAVLDNIQGIYRSGDRGETWIRINDDAHRFGVITAMTGDPRIYGRVYIGTKGRGIFYGEQK